ncbi:hypothetical protein FB381_1114 [Nocardioides albertanoniae]|uniref:Uncharacterized protein n=2 Tax=Nocardioides albertanoniae TaxID=1175486 RepID=A0A543A3S6_9ACTN|nr:hypothetical protein FB381_1114 [Nocardioides albertanoniae]
MACNPINKATDGCKDADEAVVNTVMETVNPDPKINGMRKIEFVRAKVIDLPDDMQKFGFNQIMVITTNQFFDENHMDEDSRLPGVETPTTFALNSETDHVAPIDKFAKTTFTLTDAAQKDPDWDDWVKSITTTEAFSTVSGCADSA